MLVGDTGDAEATAQSWFTVETKARKHCGQFRCWNSLVCLGNATDSLLIKMCGDSVGCVRSFCPRPCSHARKPLTQRITLCVYPVYSCPLWSCHHRMCVIAQETGKSPRARTSSRTRIFLRRLHIWALRSLCLNTAHFRKPPSIKIGDNFP